MVSQLEITLCFTVWLSKTFDDLSIKCICIYTSIHRSEECLCQIVKTSTLIFTLFAV